MVLASPNNYLGEALVCATRVVSERANSVGFSWLVQLTLNSNGKENGER